MKIFRIVLTGGPCAGKTTYLKYIKDEFKKNGIPCLIVPEAATLLINKGFNPAIWDTYAFQGCVLDRQLFEEREISKFINEYSSQIDTLVIVYDRAIYDNKAYFSNTDDFKTLLMNHGLDGMQVLDSYDMVLDLLSLATCKPEAYTLINNAARSEDPETAKRLDRKTANAWANHRNVKIISGACSEEEETKNVLNYIYEFLNKRNVIETQKYLVDEVNSDFYRFGEMETITINSTYLNAGNGEDIYELSERIGFGKTYLLDAYKYENGKKIMCRSEVISEDVYKTLYSTFEHLGYDSREVFSFVDNEILYRLCYYSERTILEVQKNDFSDIKIPDYISVIDRIDDKDFGSQGFSRKLRK